MLTTSYTELHSVDLRRLPIISPAKKNKKTKQKNNKNKTKQKNKKNKEFLFVVCNHGEPHTHPHTTRRGGQF